MKSKVIVGLLTGMMVMAALTCGTACGKETEDVSTNVRVEATKIVSENKDEGTAQGEAGAVSEDGEKNAESAVPSGVYVRLYTEEFMGEEVTSEFYYTFREDHTGEVSIQDVVPFTWDESKITFADHEREYVLEGNVLKVMENGDDFVEYVKN